MGFKSFLAANSQVKEESWKKRSKKEESQEIQRWRIEKIDEEVGVFGWVLVICSKLEGIEVGKGEKFWEISLKLPSFGQKNLKRGSVLETLILPSFWIEYAEREILVLTEEHFLGVL